MIAFEDFVRERERERPGFRELLDAAVRRQKLLFALASRRRAVDRTQPEVAAIMRTSQSSVARLEAGDGNPRMSTIERYAAAVDARVEWHLRKLDSSKAQPEDVTIGDIMTEPTVLPADRSVISAAQAIETAGGVVVREPGGETARGIVTEQEVTAAVAEGRDLSTTTLADVLVGRTVGVDVPLARARDIMLLDNVDRLPVVDDDQRPVGLVSMAQIEKQTAGVGV